MLAMIPLALIFFGLGYGLQRLVIGPASHGDDQNILLITLGLSIVIENLLLAAFHSDTRSIDVPYGFSTFDLGFTFLALPRAVAFGVSCVVAVLLWLLLAHTDTGKAIRAVAKEKLGASLAGIDVAHIYAVTFGLGAACIAIAACLLLPTYYVHPRVGNAYVLVAFTIVVLGGMGSIGGAIAGGLFVGVVESISGLLFGESLGQLGIFVIFILVLLLRPTGSVRSQGRSQGMNAARDYGLIAIAGVLLALLPAATHSNTVINALVTVMIVGLAAQGWNLLAGYGGQFSFGHAAFFGTGAYGNAILQTRYGVNAYLAAGARDRDRRRCRRHHRLSEFSLGIARLLFRPGDTGVCRSVPYHRQRRAASPAAPRAP